MPNVISNINNGIDLNFICDTLRPPHPLKVVLWFWQCVELYYRNVDELSTHLKRLHLDLTVSSDGKNLQGCCKSYLQNGVQSKKQKRLCLLRPMLWMRIPLRRAAVDLRMSSIGKYVPSCSVCTSRSEPTPKKLAECRHSCYSRVEWHQAPVIRCIIGLATT